MTNKKDTLKNAIEKFEDSKRRKDDYMELLPKVISCFRQGSGLLWLDAEEILDEIFVPKYKENKHYQNPLVQKLVVNLTPCRFVEMNAPEVEAGCTDILYMQHEDEEDVFINVYLDSDKELWIAYDIEGIWCNDPLTKSTVDIIISTSKEFEEMYEEEDA